MGWANLEGLILRIIFHSFFTAVFGRLLQQIHIRIITFIWRTGFGDAFVLERSAEVCICQRHFQCMFFQFVALCPAHQTFRWFGKIAVCFRTEKALIFCLSAFMFYVLAFRPYSPACWTVEFASLSEKSLWIVRTSSGREVIKIVASETPCRS